MPIFRLRGLPCSTHRVPTSSPVPFPLCNTPHSTHQPHPLPTLQHPSTIYYFLPPTVLRRGCGFLGSALGLEKMVFFFVQGQLRMWVDIFDRSLPIPAPVNITPREPEEYELRVIVWNVTDVPLDEVSIVTKEEMSDIYVKGYDVYSGILEGFT